MQGLQAVASYHHTPARYLAICEWVAALAKGIVDVARPVCVLVGSNQPDGQTGPKTDEAALLAGRMKLF